MLNILLKNKVNTEQKDTTVEQFQGSSSIDITDLETVFGLDSMKNVHGFDNSPGLDNLKNYFLYTESFIDSTKSEVDNHDKCFTKYLGIYNLLVVDDESNPQLDSSEKINTGDKIFNRSLEDGY